MTESLVWLVAVVALYGLYCLLWGVSCARLAQSPQDFFLASRRVHVWEFGCRSMAQQYADEWKVR